MSDDLRGQRAGDRYRDLQADALLRQAGHPGGGLAYALGVADVRGDAMAPGPPAAGPLLEYWDPQNNGQDHAPWCKGWHLTAAAGDDVGACAAEQTIIGEPDITVIVIDSSGGCEVVEVDGSGSGRTFFNTDDPDEAVEAYAAKLIDEGPYGDA